MSFFDKAVDFFEGVQRTPIYRGLLQDFVGFLEATPEMVALDVGCGPGYLTRLLAERVKAVSCVDLSPEMVKRARERAAEEAVENASYTVGSTESIPEKSDYFDIAVATSVIYLVADPVLALREMARVVKKGGHVAMLNPSDGMTRRNVTAFVRQHKLSIVDAETMENWLYAAEGARRFSEQHASGVMASAGLSDIKHERHLGGMVLFSKATKA